MTITVGYDVIGDVHGEDGKLERLLIRMGYEAVGDTYRPPTGRIALFLGDLIDRGSGQIRVLTIVRSMVEAGHAQCIMGNHEFNAIAYVTPDPTTPGECLRPNRLETPKSIKNRQQHAEFLKQVGEGSPVHEDWVSWFKTLPVCLDLGGFRAVHGCWDSQAVQVLTEAGWTGGRALTDDLLVVVGRHLPDDQETDLIKARKLLTCGLEVPLPSGKFILDKAGHRHEEVRIANWRDWATTLHEVALVPKGQEAQLMGMDWPAGLVISAIEGSPVFVGHHWFRGPRPVIESPKLACLDWSAAAGGPLCAYRWDGEAELSNDKLVWAS